jgi:3-oxoacyl-[acyl-carrier-protein] synthase-3
LTCDAYIQSGKAQKILMVGAETQSRFLELTTQNRDTAVIFADGAGAVCIEAQETGAEIGILASVFHADGNYADVLRAGVPARKSGPVMNAEVLAKHGHAAAYISRGTAGKSRYSTGSSGYGYSPPGQPANK